IVDAAFRIHTTLGPGLLEAVYQTVLTHELGRRGLRTVSHQPIPVVHDRVRIDTGLKADLVVENKQKGIVKSNECGYFGTRLQVAGYRHSDPVRCGIASSHQSLQRDDGSELDDGLRHLLSPTHTGTLHPVLDQVFAIRFLRSGFCTYLRLAH